MAHKRTAEIGHVTLTTPPFGGISCIVGLLYRYAMNDPEVGVVRVT